MARALHKEARTLGFSMTRLEIDSPFSETQELELGAELLAANDERDLNEFLGRLLFRSRFAGRSLPPALGRSIGRLLKGAIHRVLPNVGRAPSGWFDSRTGHLNADAGPVLGLEMEGMSPEDQELSAAQQLVRLIGAAISAARRNNFQQEPEAGARAAMATAAQLHAPGLLNSRRDTARHPCGCGSTANQRCRCHEH